MLRRLDAEGRLIAAGPFGDGSGGLVIGSFESVDEAQAVADADPYVVEGYRRAEVRPWHRAHAGNDYLGLPPG